MIVAVAASLALPAVAAAQSFPSPLSAWTPLPCGNGRMVDDPGDTPNATGALDIVGNAANAAGYHAADKDYLYLRLRVAADPRTGGVLDSNAWGFALDLDENRSTYELLFTLSGIGPDDRVGVYTNGSVQIANDPADPSDLPPRYSYSAATNAQLTAAGTTLGGGNDWFIDLALPWADLDRIPLAAASRVGVWAGTSTVANALDRDLACWSGLGGGHLGDIGIGYTTPDPTAGGGGGGGSGGSGGGTGPRALEGGPGCTLVPVPATESWLPLLLGALTVALLLARRAQRR